MGGWKIGRLEDGTRQPRAASGLGGGVGRALLRRAVAPRKEAGQGAGREKTPGAKDQAQVEKGAQDAIVDRLAGEIVERVLISRDGKHAQGQADRAPPGAPGVALVHRGAEHGDLVQAHTKGLGVAQEKEPQRGKDEQGCRAKEGQLSQAQPPAAAVLQRRAARRPKPRARSARAEWAARAPRNRCRPPARPTPRRRRSRPILLFSLFVTIPSTRAGESRCTGLAAGGGRWPGSQSG